MGKGMGWRTLLAALCSAVLRFAVLCKDTGWDEIRFCGVGFLGGMFY